MFTGGGGGGTPRPGKPRGSATLTNADTDTSEHTARRFQALLFLSGHLLLFVLGSQKLQNWGILTLLEQQTSVKKQTGRRELGGQRRRSLRDPVTPLM